jgi:hypothetical protein
MMDTGSADERMTVFATWATNGHLAARRGFSGHVRSCHEHTWPDREGSAKEVRPSHLSRLVGSRAITGKTVRIISMKGAATI